MMPQDRSADFPSPGTTMEPLRNPDWCGHRCTWMEDLASDCIDLWVRLYGVAANDAPVPFLAGSRRFLPGMLARWIEDELGQLQRVCLQIQANPSHCLERRVQWVEPAFVRSIELGSIMELSVAASGEEQRPVRIRESHLTQKTPENHFVATFLGVLESDLLRLQDHLRHLAHPTRGPVVGGQAEASPYGADQAQLVTLVEELEATCRRARGCVAGLRSLPVFEPFRYHPPYLEATPRLLASTLHRQVFEMWRRYLRADPREAVRDSLARLQDHRLFELWCLFRERERLELELGEAPEFSGWDDFDLMLVAGRSELSKGPSGVGSFADRLDVERTFHWECRGLRLVYQWHVPSWPRKSRCGHFQSISRELRPDIAIINDKSHSVEVLDAKLKTSALLDIQRRRIWLDSEGKVSPYERDWDQMHVYRDAIRKVGDGSRAIEEICFLAPPESPGVRTAERVGFRNEAGNRSSARLGVGRRES